MLKIPIKSLDEYTVGQVYKRQLSETKHHSVYVYYDGDNVPLYVGKSSNVCQRLDFHLGEGWVGSQSQLGETLRHNRPESAQWKVELYETDYPDFLETDLIKMLHPVLNVCYNESPQYSRFLKPIEPLEVGLTESLF